MQGNFAFAQVHGGVFSLGSCLLGRLCLRSAPCECLLRQDNICQIGRRRGINHPRNGYIATGPLLHCSGILLRGLSGRQLRRVIQHRNVIRTLGHALHGLGAALRAQ